MMSELEQTSLHAVGLCDDEDDFDLLEKQYMAKRSKEMEEMVEVRRLRTENRLLLQRIQSLEAESAGLADKLIQGQVSRAEEAEEIFGLRRELQAERQRSLELAQRLDDTESHIQLTEQTLQAARDAGKQDAADLLKVLQEELVQSRLREAETQETVKELRARIAELEESVKLLRLPKDDHNVSAIQEELLATKLREAEATLTIRELKNKISDMYLLWEKQQENSTVTNGRKKQAIEQLQEDLMSTRLSEAKAVAELRETSHRAMDLESQLHVTGNQLKRQAERIRDLSEDVERLEAKEKSTHDRLRDDQRRFSDKESQLREDLMNARIRETERGQQVAELQQKLAAMETKFQELVASRQLQRGSDEELHVLVERLADLESQVIHLKAVNAKLIAESDGTPISPNSALSSCVRRPSLGTLSELSSEDEMA